MHATKKQLERFHEHNHLDTKKSSALFLAALLLFLLLFGCAKKPPSPDGGGENGLPPEPNGNGFSLGPGNHEFSIQYGGLERIYSVHVPPSYDRGDQVPVVLNLHGGGFDIQGAKKQTKMDETSDREGFIVVYLQGVGRKVFGRTLGVWNAGKCCGIAEDDNVDDVGYASAVIDDLSENFNVDQKRVFATGHSNGSIMVYRLACELADRIAAVAPNGAVDGIEACSPSRPVSVVHFHGRQDPATPYEGGHCGEEGERGYECMSVPGYIKEWANKNGCSLQPETTYQNGGSTCITYGSCKGKAEVVLCTQEGAGHTWAGGDYYRDDARWKEIVGKISQDISNNDFMWEFFKKHPLE